MARGPLAFPLGSLKCGWGQKKIVGVGEGREEEWQSRVRKNSHAKPWLAKYITSSRDSGPLLYTWLHPHPQAPTQWNKYILLMLIMALSPARQGKSREGNIERQRITRNTGEAMIWELGLRYWIERSGGHINPP